MVLCIVDAVVIYGIENKGCLEYVLGSYQAI
jgi:hypothetical protein